MKARRTLCHGAAAASLLVLTTGCSIDRLHTNPEAGGTVATGDTFDHSVLDEVLQRHVAADGTVDYAALKRDPGPLQQYVDSLATFDPRGLADRERMAWWINAYNAITLRAVVHFWPVDSVRDLPGFWTEVRTDCGGREVSLDDIEHRILRPMGDPRIHMAINCASRSCPVLADRAYRGEDLDARLDAASRRFLADPRRNRFDDRARVARLSRIFDWFGEDFEVETYGGVRGFVRMHLLPVREWLRGEFAVEFLPYDWGLNGPTGR